MINAEEARRNTSMKCYRCGSKVRCIGKEPEYCYDVVVGVRRRYECKKCGAVFVTVEKRKDTESGI